MLSGKYCSGNILLSNINLLNHEDVIWQCKFSDVKDIYEIALHASSFFNNHHNVISGIYEIAANAVEHGNLGIGFEEKRRLILSGIWKSELQRRIAMNDVKNCFAMLEVITDQHGMAVRIRDCGRGFLEKEHIAKNKLPPSSWPNGRGIILARNLSFDEVTYHNNGTLAMCRVF